MNALAVRQIYKSVRVWAALGYLYDKCKLGFKVGFDRPISPPELALGG